MRDPSVVVRPPPTEAPTTRSLRSGMDEASRGVWAASAAIRRSPTIRYSPTSGLTSAFRTLTAARSSDVAARARTRATIGWATSPRLLIVASWCSVRRLTNRPAPTARTATRPTTAKAAAIRDETRSGIGDQAIADAPDGLDRGAIRTELLPKLRDMNVDGPGLTRKVGAPDVLQERLPAGDPPRGPRARGGGGGGAGAA